MTVALEEKINQLPELPGIYKMLDSRGNIIYIGKSKCLRKRVKSYFTKHPKWDKVNRMVSFIHDIDITVTDTHLEARLLECELIKEIKPAFNSQMKQDQGYVYLKVGADYRRSPLTVVSDRSEDSYGPFRSRFKLGELTALMKNIYPVSRKESTYEFEYRMVPVNLDKTSFQENRNNLIGLFSDDNEISDFIEEAESKMKEAASQYQYETASRYRDLITGMTIVKHGVNGYRNLMTKNLVVKIPTAEGGNKLFFISQGNILRKNYFDNLTDQEVKQFIAEGLNQAPDATRCVSEKSAIDYRDILFSEILSLPEETVQFLPEG